MSIKFRLLFYVLLVALVVAPAVSFAENRTITDLAGNTIELPQSF